MFQPALIRLRKFISAPAARELGSGRAARSSPGRVAADHVADVQLRHLVVGQVERSDSRAGAQLFTSARFGAVGHLDADEDMGLPASW